MSAWSAAWRIPPRAAAAGAVWGLLEAGVRFAAEYHVHAFHSPRSGLNLFLAAIVNYAFAGFLFGSMAAAARLLIGLTPAGRNVNELLFFMVSVVCSGGAVWALFVVKGQFLRRMFKLHPVALITYLVTLAVFAGLGWLAYRALGRWLPRRFREAEPRVLRPRLLATVAGVVVLLVLAGTAVGWMRVGQPVAGGALPASSPAPAPSPGAGPNVILVSIETTRADHLNLFGYEAARTSPNLERLAARGALFTRFFSQAPWTRPSMASLFTSLHPSQHGMVRPFTGLSSAVTTLPMVLEEAGYRTATFFTNPHSGNPTFRFQENFHEFELTDPYYVSPVASGPFLIHWIMRKTFDDILSVRFPSADLDWYYDAVRVNRAVDDWLESRARGPFLLHVHYLDPHDPYFEHPHRLVQFDPLVRWNRESIVRRYDSEIRFVDRALGELMDRLEAGGHLENAIVVITADHGEEFWDHGEWGHGRTLYAEQIHVPLIVIHPGEVPAGLRLDGPASTIDIAPTILDLVGLQAPRSFEGRSLMPAIRGEDTPREVVSQLTEHFGQFDSLILDDWKLIRTVGPTRRLELFHTADDPRDRNDLAQARPEVVERLRGRLEEILAALDQRSVTAEEMEMDAEEIERLKALGYLN